MASDCLFCKIADKVIPSDIVYETESVVAFRDISPQAPLHVLIIPRLHISTLNDINSSCSEVVAKVYEAAAEIAKANGVAEDGYRVVANCNSAAGQTVFHIHFHMLGGRSLNWPPG